MSERPDDEEPWKAGRPRYLTARDIANELQVSIARAYEIMQECTHLRAGRNIRVSPTAFAVWKRRHEEPPRGRFEAPPLPSPTPSPLDRPWQPRRQGKSSR